MSDPYREATRTYRRRLPKFVRVGLVVGGLFALGSATLALVALLVAGRVVKDQVIDDLRVASDRVALERVEVQRQRPDLWDGQQAIEADLAELRERLNEHRERVQQYRLEVKERRARAKRTRATYEMAARELARAVERWDADNSAISGDELTVRIGERADGLPHWVPVHPEAKASGDIVFGRDETGAFGVSTFEVSAGPADVFRWYRTEFKDAGIEHSLKVEVEGAANRTVRAGTITAASYRGSDRDSRWLSVTVSGDVASESSEVVLIFRN